MATVVAYRRPASLEQALELLDRDSSVVLAGGTLLNAEPSPRPVEAIDLQALGLDRIERRPDGRLEIGSMVRLQTLADDPRVPSAVRDAARRELPGTLRAAATLGGTVCAAEPDSELIAALLVHDAVVVAAGPGGTRETPLQQVLADPAAVEEHIITAVTMATGGVTAAERVARTPADRAIVAAIGRRSDDGALQLALAGVASSPILLGAGGAASLDPPGDHRGSREFRLALATTLCVRVLTELAP